MFSVSLRSDDFISNTYCSGKWKDGQVIRNIETHNTESVKESEKDMVRGIPDLLKTGLAGEHSLMSYAQLPVQRTDDD